VLGAAVPRVTHIAPVGDLDVLTMPQVEESIAAGPGDCVVLDLSGVTFLDSTAISLILRLHRSAESDGWDLRLVPGPVEVQRVFRLVDLERRLPFVG
jgi:anti-sigma B factor antagonist